MQIEMTNNDILNTYLLLTDVFKNSTKNLPVKVGFTIQKNINTLQKLAQEIDNFRAEIAKKYADGAPDEEGRIKLKSEYLATAQQEMDDLSDLVQTFDVRTLMLDDLQNLEFTLPQISALDFMIKENDEL